MMWSVLLAVSLGMLLLEVIPTSQQQLIEDNVFERTLIPLIHGRKRDVSDEKPRSLRIASRHADSYIVKAHPVVPDIRSELHAVIKQRIF
ncbi:hypothetical protein J6590_075711 [Homalodisca vitripennis]|nr:hypothetical protein J6590_075711 [Homalodisca vitripennis]